MISFHVMVMVVAAVAVETEVEIVASKVVVWVHISYNIATITRQMHQESIGFGNVGFF
jgi:hypothetical protein